MIWILSFLIFIVLFALAVLGAGWYGCEVLFHPPDMLPLEPRPERFGFPYESVEFSTSDALRLKGWLIPAQTPTDRTLVLCHGWGDNKGDLLQRTDFLRPRFNLFYFDFRHHGDSEGGQTSLCALETRDIAAALACLRKRRPEWAARLGLLGYSMGSGPATWACAQDPGIKALLLEAPFRSFEGVVAQWTRNQYRLPYFPVVWAILALCRFRLGLDPEPFSPVHHIARVHPRPLSIIAGEDDSLMTPAAVRDLYEKALEPKNLWVIPGAEHGKCREAAGAEYERRVIAFFEKNL